MTGRQRGLQGGGRARSVHAASDSSRDARTSRVMADNQVGNDELLSDGQFTMNSRMSKIATRYWAEGNGIGDKRMDGNAQASLAGDDGHIGS